MSRVFPVRRRFFPVLVVLLFFLGLCPRGSAAAIKPGERDRLTARAVAVLLSRDHLSQHPLDDEISRRCLKLFLQRLDRWKVYFNQPDVDQFMLHEDDLDDQIRRGDTRFAYTVFNTLLERVDQRAKLADELLAVEHDFSVDEQMVIDPGLARYARNQAEARERWRKLVKFELLSLKGDGIEGKEATEKLERRYGSRFRLMHQTESEELLEIYLTALARALDPHSSYMSPGSAENFKIDMSLKLEGIGVLLEWIDGETVVKRIVPGGAAAKDGRLKLGDRIVGVGQGKDGEIEEVTEMKPSDVVQRIRGKPGTVVRLEVTSPDNPKRRTIELQRAKIELKDAEARSEVFEEGRKPDGGPYRIGVIDLPSFYMDMDAARLGLREYKSATRDVRRILERLKEKQVDAVVLDLRQNNGGFLVEAINLTGLFIDEGPVVQVRNPGGYVAQHVDPERGALWDGPLVVLTSKVSASASEILAGAIQDYRRGLIVGDRATHGKGTVQTFIDLRERLFPHNPDAPEYGALKITIQQYYRPNGESTQTRGVVADVELPSLTAHLPIGEADLDYSIPFDRVAPLKFEKLDGLNKALCDRLNQRSAERCRSSESFKAVLGNIARYTARKEEKYVTLNEKEFLKQRAELSADDLESSDTPDPNGPGIRRDDYLGEVFAITLDYLELKEQT